MPYLQQCAEVYEKSHTWNERHIFSRQQNVPDLPTSDVTRLAHRRDIDASRERVRPFFYAQKSDNGFSVEVAASEYFVPLPSVQIPEGLVYGCREYKLPRDNTNTEVFRALKDHVRFGPVLEVGSRLQYDTLLGEIPCGHDGRMKSTWQCISSLSSIFIMLQGKIPCDKSAKNRRQQLLRNFMLAR